MTGPLTRVREHLKEPLHRASWSVMSSTLLMAGIGVFFWVLAARIYSPETIGHNQAMVFSMMLLASVFQLNMTNIAVRFLPQVKEGLGKKIAGVFTLAAISSMIGALLFALIAPAVSDEYAFLTHHTALTIVFTVATGAWAIFLVQDPVLMALGRAPWMPAKNAIYSAAKLLLLPAMYFVVRKQGMFIAWILPLIVLVPWLHGMIMRIAVPAAAKAQQTAAGVVDAFGHPRTMLKFMFQDFLGGTATQIAIYATPLLTLAILGPRDSAFYALPFAVVTGLDAMFVAVAGSLTAEGARSPERIKHLTGLVTRRLVVFQIPISLAVFVAAPLVMIPFGPEYVDHGTGVVRIIALAGVFRGILLYYEAAARLEGHGMRLMFVQVSNTVILIALTLWIGAEHGINGVAWAWFGAAAITAIMVAPWLVKFLRNPTVLVGPADDEFVDPTAEALTERTS